MKEYNVYFNSVYMIVYAKNKQEAIDKCVIDILKQPKKYLIVQGVWNEE